MNEKEIQSFSLETLLTVNEPRPEDLYFDGCLIASRVKIMDTVNIDLFRYPTRLDAFAILFCSEGSISFTSGLRRHTLDAKMLFVLLPGSILQVESIRPESSVYTVICEEEFIRRINIDIKNMMPLFLKFVENPTLALTPEESRSMRGMIAQIERETRGPETHFSFDIVSGLIAATIFKVGDIMYHYLAEHPEGQNNSHNRAEEYFKQFTHLLGEHFREERSVGFYARQLCITPKYLTTLIKRISGQSVSEWIDNYVILEAKTLLKYSTMSIQEIAYYLNFPNQSFFGSYFKRNTGKSPSQYKAQN